MYFAYLQIKIKFKFTYQLYLLFSKYLNFHKNINIF